MTIDLVKVKNYIFKTQNIFFPFFILFDNIPIANTTMNATENTFMDILPPHYLKSADISLNIY